MTKLGYPLLKNILRFMSLKYMLLFCGILLNSVFNYCIECARWLIPAFRVKELRVLNLPDQANTQQVKVITILYVLEWRTVSALMRGLFLCWFPELRNYEGNKHKNNTRVSTKTVRHSSTYIILCFTWHNESINDDKNDDLYISSSSHLLGFCSADDVTIDCWWRHIYETIVMRSRE